MDVADRCRPGELDAVVALADGGYVVDGLERALRIRETADFYVARFDTSQQPNAPKRSFHSTEGGDNDDRGDSRSRVAGDRV